MNAWSSLVTKLHDHLTPTGRRASKPERAARKAANKANARQMREAVKRSEQTRTYGE